MPREPRNEDAPSQTPITAYVTPDERDFVDTIAKHRGLARAALARQLILEGLAQKTSPGPEVEVPEIMNIPCGMPNNVEKLREALGEGAIIRLYGEEARDATPHSFIVRAEGVSMYDGSSSAIDEGDRILMTPLDEYPGYIENGKFVIACIDLHDGSSAWTLKQWQGGRLLPTNPKFDPVEFGDDVVSVTIIAVARRVLGKAL